MSYIILLVNLVDYLQILLFEDQIVLARIGLITIGLLTVCAIWTFIKICYYIWVVFLPYNKANLVRNYGKWALITGCTDGIGKAYATELAKRGLNIALASRNKEKLEAFASTLETQYSIETKIIPVDFTNGTKAIDVVREHLEFIPPIGILVNNVGTHYDYPMLLDEVPEQDLWDMINVNVGVTTLLTRLVIKQMRERRKGAIVNISSGSDSQPLPFMNVYASTKGYVKYFSEALREEYSEHGVTIQYLTPFYINTKMMHYVKSLPQNSVFMPSPESFAKYAVDTLGRMNRSAGYWVHEIQYFLMSMSPLWIRIKLGGWFQRYLKKDYLSNQNFK